MDEPHRRPILQPFILYTQRVGTKKMNQDFPVVSTDFVIIHAADSKSEVFLILEIILFLTLELI